MHQNKPALATSKQREAIARSTSFPIRLAAAVQRRLVSALHHPLSIHRQSRKRVLPPLLKPQP